MALAMRMRRMTNGSTKAVIPFLSFYLFQRFTETYEKIIIFEISKKNSKFLKKIQTHSFIRVFKKGKNKRDASSKEKNSDKQIFKLFFDHFKKGFSFFGWQFIWTIFLQVTFDLGLGQANSLVNIEESKNLLG